MTCKSDLISLTNSLLTPPTPLATGQSHAGYGLAFSRSGSCFCYGFVQRRGIFMKHKSCPLHFSTAEMTEVRFSLYCKAPASKTISKGSSFGAMLAHHFPFLFFCYYFVSNLVKSCSSKGLGLYLTTQMWNVPLPAVQYKKLLTIVGSRK